MTPVRQIRGPVAVLLSRFPLITETFILREVIELERQGQPVLLVPMIREHPKVIHEEARPWVQRALFTPFLSTEIAAATFRALMRRPALMLRLLWWIVAGTLLRPGTLLKSLMLVPKSVHLAEQLQREGVSHLHAHFATHPTTMALIISALSGIPFSFTVHAHDIFVDRTLLREKVRRATFIRSISRFNKRYLQALYGPELGDRIEVVHVGIEPEKYTPAATPSAMHRPPRLICIAALKPYKGVPFLVEACRLLLQEGTEVRCEIIGVGPMQNAIRRAIVKAGLHGRVLLRGALPQHMVADEIRRADLFVLPSIVASDGQMEGIPVALMEAMAAGKPVIATALSGIPELVEDGRTGLLADPANPRHLAQCIRTLLSDEKLRAEVAAAGREKVSLEFDLRTCVSELLAIFDRQRPQGDAVAPAFLSALAGSADFGVRRIRRSSDAAVYELCKAGEDRDVIAKQHLRRDGESRPPQVRAREEWQILQRLSAHFATHPQLGIPQPISFDEQSAAVLMARVGGDPLSEVIRRARTGGDHYALGEAFGATGRWLSRFQDFESGDGAAALQSLVDRALHDARSVGVSRTLTERLHWLREDVEERGAVAVSHHGDLWPGNIFVRGKAIDVIDFEGYSLSLKSHDINYLLLHASLYLALRGRDLMDLIRQSFFDQYQQTLDPAELELCRLATALKLASLGDRHLPLAQKLARRKVLRGELSR